jgi:hypothetical protein
MRRLDLDVPFQDRHLAKRLGAHWDVYRKRWFVPESTDPAALLGWSCASASVNVRSHGYYLLETQYPCDNCGRSSRVHGIVLPTGHEVRMLGDYPLGDEWERSDEPSLIAFVTNLAPSVSARIRQDTWRYRPRQSFKHPEPYHLNHCEFCGGQFDDYQLFATPGSGFDVLSEIQAAEIQVTAVGSGFAGAAEHFSYGVVFLDAMRRR